MVVDALLARAPALSSQEAGDVWLAEAEVGGQRALLVKPLTFMNRSGIAVERLLAGAQAAPQDLVVVVDDVALDLGKLRVRERGSHGGHNGLRSLIDTLGTDEFPRVRLGIRRADVVEDLAEYVLSDFPAEEVLIVQEMVGTAADAVECVLRDGPAVAMNRFNSRPGGVT
jgi:PTH1 family peptidyl-tRNA hydrolase